LVLVVQGSPRSDGNCAALALEAFNACEVADLETIIVSAFDLMSGTEPCNGCLTCVATGKCAHEDGVATLVDMLNEASGLLWITPVYFSSVPACLKGLIDRLQIFWAQRQRGTALIFPQRRPASALIVGSGQDPFGTQAVTLPLTSVSNIAEFTLSEPTVLSGLDDVDALLREENAHKLDKARATIQIFIKNVREWDTAMRSSYEGLLRWDVTEGTDLPISEPR